MQKEAAKQEVRRLCRQLVSCTELLVEDTPILTPPIMDRLHTVFRALAPLIKSTSVDDAEMLLCDPEIRLMIPTIRCVRAKYEFELERAEALALLKHADPGAEIRRIIETEYAGSAIFDPALSRRIGPTAQSCLVVGSGPLPITALMLRDTYGLKITCLDISAEGCELSEKIFRAMALGDTTDHIVADIAKSENFCGYEIIFINGLVGVSGSSRNGHGKTRILDHVRSRIIHECLVILRSGFGLAQLYYPRVDIPAGEEAVVEMIQPAKLGRSAMVLFDCP